MALVDIESEFSEAEHAVRDQAHKFAEEVMRPAGVAARQAGGSGRRDREAIGAVAGVRPLPRTRLRRPRVTRSRDDARAGRATALPRQRRTRLGRLGTRHQSRRLGLPSLLRQAFRPAGADRTLLRAGKPRHRLLGGHRARPRQRHARLRPTPLQRRETARQLHRAQGRRQLGDPRPEVRVGFERHDRDGRRAVLHDRPGATASRAAAWPSCRSIFPVCRAASRSTRSASAR